MSKGYEPPCEKVSEAQMRRLIKETQPNPHQYEILDHTTVNGHLILKLKYKTAKNYDGLKILVFDKGVTAVDLLQQRWIDPHFLESDKAHYPVARFEPTERGWEWARAFCETTGE